MQRCHHSLWSLRVYADKGPYDAKDENASLPELHRHFWSSGFRASALFHVALFKACFRRSEHWQSWTLFTVFGNFLSTHRDTRRTLPTRLLLVLLTISNFLSNLTESSSREKRKPLQDCHLFDRNCGLSSLSISRRLRGAAHAVERVSLCLPFAWVL